MQVTNEREDRALLAVTGDDKNVTRVNPMIHKELNSFMIMGADLRRQQRMSMLLGL